MKDESVMKAWFGSVYFFLSFFIISCLFILHSCTLSFQNISTHGTANDLIDEQQATSPTISPTVTVPLK